MNYHKGKRPDVDWSKVKEVTVKSHMPLLNNIYSYTEPKVKRPDEEKFNKDLNKLIMKYGFDRIYDAVRDEHYLREYCSTEPKMSLKELVVKYGYKETEV